MGIWSGFVDDLLNAGGFPTAKMTEQFIYDWNYAASSNCDNNPVDISRSASGAKNCHKLTSSRTAKAYTSPSQAQAAFKAQVHSGNFPHLLAALKTDNPYAYSNPAGVVSDLNKWGSPKQATYYGKNATGGSGSGSGSGSTSVALPKGHTGFRDMQKALGKSLPTHLRRSKIIRGRVLKKLGAPRRVA